MKKPRMTYRDDHEEIDPLEYRFRARSNGNHGPPSMSEADVRQMERSALAILAEAAPRYARCQKPVENLIWKNVLDYVERLLAGEAENALRDLLIYEINRQIRIDFTPTEADLRKGNRRLSVTDFLPADRGRLGKALDRWFKGLSLKSGESSVFEMPDLDTARSWLDDIAEACAKRLRRTTFRQMGTFRR